MTNKEAKAAGEKQAVYFALAGMAIAYFIMAAMSSYDEYLNLDWIANADYKLNLFAGGAIMLFASYLLGTMAGWAIITRGLNYIVTGMGCGLLIVVVTTFLSGWIGFLQEGIGHDNGFADYVLRPTLMVAIFGCVPAAILGILLGRRLKKMI